MAVTMDDAQIRRVVDGPAENLELPSAVGLEKARTAGRRRIRWWRLAAVGSVLAVAAAVAIALSVIGSLGSAGQNGRIRHSMPAEPRRSPRSFNPLVPYASFGWLPSGARVTTFDLTRTLVSVETGPGRTRSRWRWMPQSPAICPARSAIACEPRFCEAPRSLACMAQRRPRVLSRLPLTGAAPAVRGRRAWWSYRQSDRRETGLKPRFSGSSPRVPGPSSASASSRAAPAVLGVRLSGRNCTSWRMTSLRKRRAVQVRVPAYAHSGRLGGAQEPSRLCGARKQVPGDHDRPRLVEHRLRRPTHPWSPG